MNLALWPLAIYFLAVLALAVIMIGFSQLLGERHHERTTGYLSRHESGIGPTGSAASSFNTNFYLIAVFFVIFDVETLFIISWGIADPVKSGWPGYIEIVIFIGILFVALIYLWSVGGLELKLKNRPSVMNRVSQRTRS